MGSASCRWAILALSPLCKVGTLSLGCFLYFGTCLVVCWGSPIGMGSLGFGHGKGSSEEVGDSYGVGSWDFDGS